MKLRKREEGRCVVEQARDLELVRAILTEGGMCVEGVEWPAACYLLAYLGNEPVAVVGVEPMLDAALMRSLYVPASMRRRGVGSALVGAARKAAHTRGVRSLYALGTGADDYLRRFGFTPVPAEELMSALDGTPGVDYYRAHPELLGEESAFLLDISQDGIIVR